MVDVAKKVLETIKLSLILNPAITKKYLRCNLQQQRQQQQQ